MEPTTSWFLVSLVSCHDGNSSLYFFIFIFLSYLFFRATLVAYGSSLGLNQSYSYLPTPQPQQHQIQAVSSTYITALGNAGSLTH